MFGNNYAVPAYVAKELDSRIDKAALHQPFADIYYAIKNAQ